VVGIAGVSGNGQSELLLPVRGKPHRARPAAFGWVGTDVSRAGPGQRRALGLHFVPEERLGRGAVPTLELAQNLLLSRRDAMGPLAAGCVWGSCAQAADIIERYKVKANGPDAAAKSLSGGNLQKFIVGREIEAKPRCSSSASPPGAWMWAQRPRSVAKSWPCAMPVARCWW
jgi:general nucleoside transport system ATP-binding protein